jgi:hypothetical protein
MVPKLRYTLLLIFCFSGAFAQPHDLVSASGASFQNSSGYLSFSIGELISTTLSSSSLTLTQGFHQTRLRTGVPVITQREIQMSVFPNPVKDLLILQIDDPPGFNYMLFDVRGRLLERAEVFDERTTINFGNLEPAVYILRVTNLINETRLFQIVKY